MSRWTERNRAKTPGVIKDCRWSWGRIAGAPIANTPLAFANVMPEGQHRGD
ncbi:hypothetical protein KCP76_16520 [Salmonella enterica subsp. enterica serovar Weltevreden]|nr:hypothetical protein KCP76_16520 [Salmonella enterica subsp. enterica serovar Weltevreden]